VCQNSDKTRIYMQHNTIEAAGVGCIRKLDHPALLYLEMHQHGV